MNWFEKESKSLNFKIAKTLILRDTKRVNEVNGSKLFEISQFTATANPKVTEKTAMIGL